jgi:hypothetical protein
VKIRPRRLSEAEKRSWLRLIRSKNIGPITIHNLVRYYGSAARAVEALSGMAKRTGAKRRITGDYRPGMSSLRRAKAALITGGEPGYPVRLMQLDDTPPLLAARSNTDIASLPGIASVHPRSPWRSPAMTSLSSQVLYVVSRGLSDIMQNDDKILTWHADRRCLSRMARPCPD